tara:strand:- start:208 stop:552 length:345 start_codon:yes stop_codon:yes gene_type:complete
MEGAELKRMGDIIVYQKPNGRWYNKKAWDEFQLQKVGWVLETSGKLGKEFPVGTDKMNYVGVEVLLNDQGGMQVEVNWSCDNSCCGSMRTHGWEEYSPEELQKIIDEEIKAYDE